MITYDILIQGINNGDIEECSFSVKGYNHYRYCTIRRVYLEYNGVKSFEHVELCLTKDRSEICRYYGHYSDGAKAFHIKGKGSFTLKEIWKQVEVTNIVYKK